MNLDLYTNFHQLTFEKIKSLSNEIEGFKLECKEVLEPEMLSKESKKILAITISAFSNAEGGLIIWGVKAKKNKDGIDSIIGFPGISNSKLFFSRINELTPDSISPPNTGIEHKLIYDKKSDLGFVASIIPSSDIGPHMAKFGDNRYYQRIGHTSTLMEHYQISDLFGRRAIPSINISFIANPTSPLLSVLIENKGKGVAIAPYVLFSNVNSPYEVSPYPLTGNVNDFPLARTKKSSRYGQDGFVGGTSDLIHPGLNFKFRALQLPNTYNGSHPNEPLTASFTFGSIGSVVNTGKLIFDFSKKEFQLLDGASFIGVQSE